MDPRPEVITREQFDARCRALFRSGAGAHWPRRRQDRLILLGHLAATLPRDRELDEPDVNGAIRAWLAGPAAALSLDHATLRRALVDHRFLKRTADGRSYRRDDGYAVFAGFTFELDQAVRPSGLADEPCVACRPGTAPLPGGARAELLARVPGWTVVERDGIARLERVFAFPDFATALDFTRRVGEIAEAADHHPALLTEWGRVTVTWWTHSIGGLHRNDFVMAARTDGLAP